VYGKSKQDQWSVAPYQWFQTMRESADHSLVLNLMHLNQFLRKDHFKYEDLRIAMLMYEQNDLLLKNQDTIT